MDYLFLWNPKFQGAKAPLEPITLLLKMPLKSEMQTVHDFESEEFCLACILITGYSFWDQLRNILHK